MNKIQLRYEEVLLSVVAVDGFSSVISIDTHWDLEPQIIKNGVGNNTIYHVCYGSEGFMWFSTDKGISATMASDFVIIRSL